VSARFCGACGAELSVPPPAFCIHCGTRVVTASTTAGSAPPPSPPHPPPSYQPSTQNYPQQTYVSAPETLGQLGPRRSRRWPVVAAVVLVLVLVAGGVAVLTLLRGSGSGHTADGSMLPEAVTSEPKAAWTFDYSGSYAQVTGAGDLVVLADEDGDVAALDSDGERVWSNDDEYVGYVVAVPDHDDVVVVAGGEGGGVGALSTDDGEQLWWQDSGYPLAIDDEGLLLGDGAEDSDTSDVAWVDSKSGEEKWSIDDVGSTDVAEDAVYLVVADELRRVDASSGRVSWSLDLSVDDDEYVGLASTSEFVAVSVGNEVTAYDAGDGERLWSASAEDPSVDGFDDDRVYISETTYDEDTDDSDTSVTVYGRAGDGEDLSIGSDDYFYGIGVEAGGSSWFVAYSSGEVFDDDLQRVGRYGSDEANLTVADRGLYVHDPGQVAFYEYGQGKPEWTIDIPDSEDGVSVSAVDQGVVVEADGELTMYR